MTGQAGETDGDLQVAALRVDSWVPIEHAVQAVILTRANQRFIRTEMDGLAAEYERDGAHEDATVIREFAAIHDEYTAKLDQLIAAHPIQASVTE